ASGLQAVSEIFGQPFSYTTPGTSWTPAALIAYAQQGIKMSFISPYAHKYKPYWYCGQLNVDYSCSFDTSFPVDVDLDAYYAHMNTMIQATKEHDGIFVIYTHPNRIYTAEHWDVCYAHGANPDIDKAPQPCRWRQGHVDVNKDRVRKTLDFLQQHPDIEFSDVHSVYNDYQDNKFDFYDLLASEGLQVGQEKELPLKKRSAEQPFFGEDMRPQYNKWIPHDPDFYPENVFAQIEGLAYTTKLA
ncbi:MAG: hypothetical protein HRU15_05920, partial [Planctomycetes bacterium]|nr:hypothetical protein [Planctomycetota bacterium]